VDSTPLFCIACRALCSNAPADEETLGPKLWPAIESRVCSGSMVPAIPIVTVFVEYQRATEQGLANQGWKDSPF